MGKQNRIILVGAIGIGREPKGGETMKNRLFVKRFEELFDKVILADTHHWQKRPWCLIGLLWKLIFNKGAKVVISSCDNSAYNLIRFLYYIRLKKQVFYWVVGGGFHTLVNNGKINPKYYHFLKGIFVQSQDMVDALKAKGLKNVRYIANSKPIYEVSIGQRNTEPIRFVFLSRIHNEKGCKEIIECVNKLNSNGFTDRFNVTFYGNLDKQYQQEFLSSIENVSNIFYKGLLNLTVQQGYQELSGYDVLLFPTYYFNEGFPGVVIDAYIAGLPLIATRWHFNEQVVDDGKTGVLIGPKNPEALYEAMLLFINKKIDYDSMVNNCLKSAKQYDVRSVLDETTLSSIGLL